MKLHWPQNLSVDEFMADYWQQKPILIRQAFPLLADFITPDELAGLSCEEDIEARLIIEDKKNKKWHVEHGPLDEQRFSQLPESHWTLLVQDIDKHLADASELVEQFHFIPGWRIDDLMISYAADGGTVGPHTDSYDVFLVQLHGERLWKISDFEYTDKDLLQDCDLRVLENFKTTAEWLLQPGDMLYLPPDIAHWGIAQGECMTGSVGFISPGQNELFSSWADFITQRLPDRKRYRDPGIKPADNPFIIDDKSIAQISTMLKECIHTDPASIMTWFGQMISESKPHLTIEDSLTENLINSESFMEKQLSQSFYKHPYLRIFYSKPGKEQILLFANGESFYLPADAETFVRFICEQQQYPAGCFEPWLPRPDYINCLVSLINRGYIVQDETE